MLKLRAQVTPALIAAAIAANTPLAAASAQLILEEVIVTAQKREETLIKAPLTVNVLSGESIRGAAIFQADELNKLTAGLEIRWEGDTNSGVGIRGVGTFTQQVVPPRVATYVDGYDMGSQANAAFAAMWDMSRVQVLRGPQGTLYGQPSPTGAILLETQNPDMEQMKGYIRVAVQDPTGYHIEGALSIPLVDDTLAVRLALLTDVRETGNKVLLRRLDEERNRDGARIKLQWSPIDSMSMNLGYTYMQTDNAGAYRVVESLTPAAEYQLRSGDRTSIEDAISEVKKKNDHLLTYNLDWELGWGDFSLRMGNFRSDLESGFDLDRTHRPISTSLLEIDFKKQWQVEPQLSFDISDNWNMTVGAYYEDTESPAGVRAPVNRPDLGGVFIVSLDIPAAATVTAFFTHNVINISENTSIVVGVRRTEFDNSSANIIDGTFLFGAELEVGGNVSMPIAEFPNIFPCLPGSSINEDSNFTESPCRVAAASKVSKTTGTIKLQHSFSEQLNTYVTADRGFRPGGPSFDLSGVNQPSPEDPDTDLNSYLGETVTSFEIGAKGRLLEGRAEYTAAAFISIYEDYQINPVADIYNTVTGEVETTSNPAFINVDEAEQLGIEGEVRYLVNENLSLFASLAYIRVEFTNGTVLCTDPSQPPLDSSNRYNECDADGLPASPQPEFFATLQGEFHTDFSFAQWYIRGLVNYRDDITNPGDTLGRFDTDGYTHVDLFSGFRAEHWDTQLFVKNAFDDDGISASRGTDLPEYNQLTVIAPRTVGLMVSYRF